MSKNSVILLFILSIITISGIGQSRWSFAPFSNFGLSNAALRVNSTDSVEYYSKAIEPHEDFIRKGGFSFQSGFNVYCDIYPRIAVYAGVAYQRYSNFEETENIAYFRFSNPTGIYLNPEDDPNVIKVRIRRGDAYTTNQFGCQFKFVDKKKFNFWVQLGIQSEYYHKSIVIKSEYEVGDVWRYREAGKNLSLRALNMTAVAFAGADFKISTHFSTVASIGAQHQVLSKYHRDSPIGARWRSAWGSIGFRVYFKYHDRTRDNGIGIKDFIK